MKATSRLTCVIGFVAAGMSQAQAADQSSAEVPGGQPSEASALEEIVVSAEKHTESLQKAPAAITAIGGDMLQELGVVDARSLQKVLPSVMVRPEGPVSQTFIRGIGNNIDIPYSDPGVAYNINGIYLPRYATSSAFFDLDRIEALPGPQGTLYGGSAAGGVINITTREPGADTDGQATVGGGDYDLFQASLAQNVHLAQDLSLRAAVDWQRHNGYQSRGFDSDRKISGRLSLLWKPSDSLKLLLWGSAFHDGGKPAVTVNSPLLNPGDPWQVPEFGPVVGNPVDIDAAGKRYSNYVLAGRLDWEVNGLTLTYLPGFVYVSNKSLFYAADFPLTAYDTEHEYTQELRLGNNSGALRWFGGLYFLSNQLEYQNVFFGVPILTISEQRNRSYAGFGQVTYSASERLRFTLGARYSWDSKDAVGSGALGAFVADHHWDHIDWKAGASFDLTDRSMLYAAVQTGYLPGGYSPLPNSVSFDNEVRPETLVGETLGIKNRFLDDRLEVNTELYRYDYRNYQVVAIDVNTGITSVFNARKSLIYGGQLDIRALVTRVDTINLGLGLMSAHYKDFTLAGNLSYNGNQMADAPTATIALGLEHRFELRTGATVTASVQSHYESGHWGQYDHFPGTHQSDYTRTDVNVTYRSANGIWSLSAWGRNLENAVVFGATASGGQPGPASNFVDPPRTYGANVTVNW